MSSTDAHITLCNSLMAADRMWEATIDTLTDAVYIFGPDKRLKKINRAGEALELAARSFLTGRRCCDMLWGLEATGCMVDRAISNGAEVEVELPSENKAQRPLLVRVIPQNKDQQQDLATGCIVIVRDVSELRHAEEEGSKNRAFLASLADLAPDEIYTLDTEGRFTWMNLRAEVDSGLTRSVLLGQDFSIIVAAESEEEANAAVECTLGGEEKQFEVRTICTDGRVRCMDAHTSPLWSDGTGMPAEVIARIFEPFYTTKGERGTGLGLSASHGIIENHSGDINVISEPGKGTRFEVILPLHEGAASVVDVPVAKTGSARSARVLVVEDEEKVRVLLNDAFRAEGHDVTEATTGAEALKFLDKREFDLMVCDLGLPELSGLHVARWVKEFRPDLPVIIATGYAEMIAEEDYQRARIDDVIRKPYSLADVLNRANMVLAAQPRPRESVLV